MTSQRSCYYATIIYEESVVSNWQEVLENLHVPCLISPWHSKDLDENGKIKKIHRHILFLFESLKSQQQCRDIVNRIGGVGCETVMAPKSYALYLTHENAPDKAQYNPKDVIALSGAEKYLENAKVGELNKYTVIADIIRYCQAENIDCLADIVEYALENRQDWFYVLVDGTSSLMLVNYLKSRSWRDGYK